MEKVSTVYMNGIGARDRQQSTLTQKLSPPAAGKQGMMRPIHPDLVVIVFSLIAPIFGYGILTNQAGTLLPVGILLIIGYGAYFWQRKRLLERFQADLEHRRNEVERIQRGIGRWMEIYYCARDECVFKPGSKHSIPIDEISEYLLGD